MTDAAKLLEPILGETSLEQSRLGREVLRLKEITKANSDEAKALLGAQGNALPERKRNGRQLFAGGRRYSTRLKAIPALIEL